MAGKSLPLTLESRDGRKTALDSMQATLASLYFVTGHRPGIAPQRVHHGGSFKILQRAEAVVLKTTGRVSVHFAAHHRVAIVKLREDITCSRDIKIAVRERREPSETHAAADHPVVLYVGGFDKFLQRPAIRRLALAFAGVQQDADHGSAVGHVHPHRADFGSEV